MKRFAVSLMIAGALSIGCGEEKEEDAIEIGVLVSTTGTLAGIGVAQSEAAALAVEEINAAGGVLGKKLKIVQANDGSDPERAPAAAQSLIDKGVPAVVGAVGSAMTLNAAKKLSAAGIVQVSPSSTSPQLTTFADNGYLFRACPSDAFQGKVLAQRAKAKGLTKAAVTYVPGAYGEGLAQTFTAAFTELGGTVTFSEAYVEDQSSYTDFLGRIFETQPQAVLLVGYIVDAAQILKDYNLGYADRSAFWFLGDALSSGELISAVGASGFTFQHEGTIQSAPSGLRWEEFAAHYKSKLGKDVIPGYYLAQAYDSVYLIALAMEKAGKAEGTAIRDAMREISAGEAFGPSQFKEAVAALRAQKNINFEGASGSLDLDENGDSSAPYDIYQIKDGAIVIVVESLEP